MEPARDLGTIADLIAAAFAGDLDERGHAALREMRWLSRLWPLVWWWAQADPAFGEAFSGLVWEEPLPGKDGARIVGNVSLNRAPGNRQKWIICNVAVKAECRGQGIGRRLTEAAIAEARSIGASGVVLQVHRDNVPAFHLYSSLGFREVAGETELLLDSVYEVAVLNAPGYQVRPWRSSDGPATHDLARKLTPSPLQWLMPTGADKYRQSPWARTWHWFSNLLTAKRKYRLVALHQDRLAAFLSVTATFRSGSHEVALLVDPDCDDSIKTALVSRALHLLAAAPPRPVRAVVNQEAVSTLSVLQAYGFRERRTLLTLTKDLA
jgi:ribosomal protein S18 acetylase RimI-like enzyme